MIDTSSEFERLYVRPRAGRTLIAGSQIYAGRWDRRLLYPNAVGVDMQAGPGVDVVADLEEGVPDFVGMFDHVECCSVLEHTRRPWLAALTIEDLMKPGATIFFAAPFIWRPHGYPSDYWRFTVDALPLLFPRVEWMHRLYGGAHGLELGPKLPGMKVEGWPYYGRTETLGFGVRMRSVE